MTRLILLLLLAPPPEGKHEYLRLFAVTEDGRKMVVVRTNESLEYIPNSPFYRLHLTPQVVCQTRNDGEGDNPEIAPKRIRELHIQRKEIWIVATWTGRDRPPLPQGQDDLVPLQPDHILVIVGDAKDKEK